MEKVYLKYDDVRPYVECDYGFQREILYLEKIYKFNMEMAKNDPY